MFNIVFCKIVFWSYAAIQVQARKELGLTASWSCHQRVTLMSWWLLLVWPRPASCLYLCPFISGHGKYTSYWVSHWSQEGQEGRDPAPWAPREFLYRKLIGRTGFSRSSQRKSVWLDVWIPKSWSKFSWSLCIDICSCLASGNELQPKLRQSRVSPKEAWCWAVQTSHLSEGCQSFGHAFVALSSPAHRHSPIQSCGLLLTLLCSLVTYSVKRKKKKKKDWGVRWPGLYSLCFY